MRKWCILNSMAALVVATTAFAGSNVPITYQGILDFQSQPYDGLADFRIRLYDRAILGFPIATVDVDGVDVDQGLFTLVFEMPQLANIGSQTRWLEISVKRDRDPTYTTLSGRQELTYAAFAANALHAENADSATDADTLDGIDSAAFLQNVPNPLVLSANTPFYTISGENNSGTSAAMGVRGITTSASLGGYGVYGESAGSSGRGVYGRATGATASGVYGLHFNASGVGHGIRGLTTSSGNGSSGVFGEHNSESGAAYGVHGLTASNTGGAAGVFGEVEENGGASTYGVYGRNHGAGAGVLGQSADGLGVFGLSTDNVGVFGTSVNDFGVFGRSNNETGILGQTLSSDSGAYAIHGEVTSTLSGSGSAGVFGENNGTNGLGYGVYGLHASGGWGVYGRSTGGRGVYGNAVSGGWGIYGFSSSGTGTFGSSNSGIGVEARGFTTNAIALRAQGVGSGLASPAASIENTNSNGIALFSTSNSSDSNAVFVNRGGGQVIKGFAGANGGDLVFQVGTDGITMTKVLQITGGSDLSEQFDVRTRQTTNGKQDAAEPLPGMVVCIDPENPGKLVVSDQAHDRTVAGIISGAGGVETGMLMGQSGTVADGQFPVALTGRVYVHCDARSGAIQPGDLLTTADTPGHAMKVRDHDAARGAIIGKAMTALDSGTGLVLVLVSLQ